MTTLTLNYAACSDRGLVRGNNEDSAYAGPRLIALADGMGGHAAGEVASAFMIEALQPLDSPLLDAPGHSERLETMLATAMDEGNQNIAMHVQENPTLAGMGCTLTALLFRGTDIGVCHVGDSRAYRLREGLLEQITTDDTFVQSLVEQGKLDAADVSSHPQRSLILKALTGRPVEPSLDVLEAQPGDRYMLCSDGLSDPVSRDTIFEILSAFPPAQAARKLVEMALRGGGPDNVTVVVADVIAFNAETDTPENPTLRLPSSPMMVGAVAGDSAEEQRPDSPASRAAALASLKTTTDAPLDEQHTPENPEPATPQPDKPRTRKRRWIVLAAVLAVLAAISAAGFMGYNKIRSTYYVSAANSKIVVNRGMPQSIAGIQISNRYQEICLTAESTVLLLDEGSNNSCHRFETTDLTPAARGALEQLPEDNYDAVIQQVRRLAEQTLPVCVTRSPANPETTNGSTNGRANNPRTPGTPNTPTPTNPTESEAPEDLTTPGVSCREVN